jgi:hypothetical protein
MNIYYKPFEDSMMRPRWGSHEILRLHLASQTDTSGFARHQSSKRGLSEKITFMVYYKLL